MFPCKSLRYLELVKNSSRNRQDDNDEPRTCFVRFFKVIRQWGYAHCPAAIRWGQFITRPFCCWLKWAIIHSCCPACLSLPICLVSLFVLWVSVLGRFSAAINIICVYCYWHCLCPFYATYKFGSEATPNSNQTGIYSIYFCNLMLMALPAGLHSIYILM